jgi:hypothetical protein
VPQPGDVEIELGEDFDDWIDNLYGFMHMINPVATTRYNKHHITIFVSEVASIRLPATDDTPLTYDEVP